MTAPQVYLDIDLSPQPNSGFGYYYPTVQVTDPTEGITLTTSPQGVAFDGTAKSIQLYATDNSNMGPAGWGWFLDFSQNPFVPGKPSPITFFAPVGPVSYTANSATPAVFTWTTNAAFMAAFPNNVLPNGTALVLSGTAPTGFTNGTTYYVVNSSALGFSLAATRGGSAIASTGTGSGTFTVTRYTYSGLVPQAASAVYTPFVTAASGADFKAPVKTQVPNIVFDGDSLTIGSGVIPFNVFPRGGDYPSQVVNQLDPRGSYYNVGVGGEQIITMTTNAPSVVDTKLVAGRNNVVVICGGSNDIWVRDVNPYADIVTYCQARKAAGWKVIVGTITSRADTQDTLPADYETLRLACNASIRANWQTFADGLADWGGDANLGATQGSAVNLAYFTGDGAHHSWRGYQIRAKYCLAALATLGVIGTYKEQQSVGIYDAWKPAQDLYAVSGTPVFGLFPSSIDNAWKFSHGVDQVVAGDFLPPLDWVQFGVAAVYARTGSATGTIALQNGYLTQLNIWSSALADMPGPNFGGVTPAGGHLVAPVYLGQSFLGGLPLAPAGKIHASPLFSQVGNNGVTPRCAQKIVVKRTGTDATYDTCTDDVYLMGVYLWKTA